MDVLNLSFSLILVIVAVLAAFWFVQKQRPETLSDAAKMVVEAERVARVFVAGAQQIYESDQTDGVDHRYEDVEEALLDVFPNLSQRHAKQIIEAAVHAMHQFKVRRALHSASDVEGILPVAETDPLGPVP